MSEAKPPLVACCKGCTHLIKIIGKERFAYSILVLHPYLIMLCTTSLSVKNVSFVINFRLGYYYKCIKIAVHSGLLMEIFIAKAVTYIMEATWVWHPSSLLIPLGKGWFRGGSGVHSCKETYWLAYDRSSLHIFSFYFLFLVMQYIPGTWWKYIAQYLSPMKAIGIRHKIKNLFSHVFTYEVWNTLPWIEFTYSE